MNRLAVLLLMFLLVLAAMTAVAVDGAPQKAYELIAFDYEEFALETDNAVRIKWSGSVESYLTYNGDCQVMLVLSMESGEELIFATAPFPMQGLGTREVSDEFVVPRAQWDNAVGIEVGAEQFSETVDDGAEVAEESEAVTPLENCIREIVADPEAFPALKAELAEIRDEVLQLETDLMISSGLLRKEESPKKKVNRQQKHLQTKEDELEITMGRLHNTVEGYCRDLGHE
jgi:hypothetical protein